MEEKGHRLIVAYFEKTIDDEGLSALREWIEERPENLEEFVETIEILEASEHYLDKPEKASENWGRIHDHVIGSQPVVQTKKLRFKWPAVAAALVLICGTVWWYTGLFKQYTTQPEYAVLRNPDGQHSRILLPDSSVVYLGAGSQIRYAKDFAGDTRQLSLEGEAFFDVTHRKKPFIVKCGDISTVVLGTSFNIRAFAKEQSVQITVNSGKVGVMSASRDTASHLIRYLLPNEQIHINTQSGLYTSGRANAEEVSGWIDNNFAFNDVPLSDIARSLQHYYGVEIEFTDSELGRIRLTAKFRNMAIDQVMEEICLLSNLGFTQRGSHIFITNSNQRGGKIMK